MIEILNSLIPDIQSALGSPKEWGSLIINKRKPETVRIFRQFGDYRVVLHKFSACDPEDCFLHPHAWPSAFLVLAGQYVHKVAESKDLRTPPTNIILREIIQPYSMYEIVGKRTFHSVQPTTTTFTIGVNGIPYDEPHSLVRRTAGKNLKSLDMDSLDYLLTNFSVRISKFKRGD